MPFPCARIESVALAELLAQEVTAMLPGAVVRPVNECNWCISKVLNAVAFRFTALRLSRRAHRPFQAPDLELLVPR
jgi:hypothetical protein